MDGYTSSSYGDAFADVYDLWYADVTDATATARRMLQLAGTGGSVLELGVGTGRLAIPMADAGLSVVGVDSSRAMLDRLVEQLQRREAGPGHVEHVHGDMVDDLPDGPFDACLVGYNTILNLLGPDDQQRCFRAVAERLTKHGHFVVEAIVPDIDAPAGADVSVKTMSADRVVLSVSDHRPHDRRTDGQFIEFSEAGGVRLRPWAIRWSTPAELDAMATAAGLALVERFADMAATPFDDESRQHVSVYRRA
jgi:SAM-dependent methyltransferase